MKPLRRIVVSDTKTAVSAVTDLEVERVASYRLYGLDGVRKVASAEWIDADDDCEAIEAAKTKFDGGHCEVWQGPRLVARLDRSGENA
jgi:hypothetical protein